MPPLFPSVGSEIRMLAVVYSPVAHMQNVETNVRKIHQNNIIQIQERVASAK